MKKLAFVFALTVLSLIALPLAAPAQQVDDVYCEDDSHCGCAGGCQPGGWCMCGDADVATAADTPEPLDVDLDEIMASITLVPMDSFEECDAYCRDHEPLTIALWLTAGYCYCVPCSECL